MAAPSARELPPIPGHLPGACRGAPGSPAVNVVRQPPKPPDRGIGKTKPRPCDGSLETLSSLD
jgi:hypothetical protein